MLIQQSSYWKQELTYLLYHLLCQHHINSITYATTCTSTCKTTCTVVASPASQPSPTSPQCMKWTLFFTLKNNSPLVNISPQLQPPLICPNCEQVACTFVETAHGCVLPIQPINLPINHRLNIQPSTSAYFPSILLYHCSTLLLFSLFFYYIISKYTTYNLLL